jgi:hypothetical protein
MIMKRFLAVAIFILTAFLGNAQTQNPFGNKYVAFDPPGRGRIYYGIGDEIFLKMDGDKNFTPWTVTAVSDSGFVVEGSHFVDPEKVSAIKVYPKRKLRGLKRILIYGGVALPALMLLNYAIKPSESRLLVPTVAGISGGMIVTWLILKSFDWAGVRYKVSPDRPLKMLILDMKAP